MNISETFIRRPIATSLMMLGLLVFGAATYNLLPVAALPNVDFPTITVSATLPGASPETMASSVATPLEQQFAAIPGLASMNSTSGLGTTSITLQFDLGRSIDGAATDVQTAINAASGLLPKDLPNPPTYRKVNPADRAILIYAISSDALPIYKVDDYAYTILAQKISAVAGVSQVLVAGQQDFAVRAQANPAALAAHGISLEDVRTALANATVNQAKGNLENEHKSITIDTNDQLFHAAGYRNIIVAYRNGAPVKLQDVANVIDATKAPRNGAWFNGKRGELLLVFRQPGANTVEVVDNIKAMMPRLLASVPPSVHVDLVSDRSQSIRDSVVDVEFTLVLTIGLVVMVIFIFLRHLWATIIPSITVPLSLVGTFGVMYVLSYSIDNLSLMGLTIAVGFVVDDAIVMIENIVRYIEAGERPFDAALKGAGQIGFTIVSITFSLIAVFIPLLFMGGIVGRLFREFAVTVTVAVVMSAFVSLTLTPVMCARFLKRHAGHKRGRLDQMCEDAFEAAVRFYDRGLQWVFRHQFVTLLSTIVLIFVTGYLYVVIPKGFFPEQDTGFIFAQAEARQDISFAAMADLQNRLSAIVQKDPAVSGVVGFVGSTGGNSSENTARMFIQLKPFGERAASAQQIIQRLRPKVAEVPGVKFFMQAGQDINVGGRLSKTEFQYTLTSTDSEELNHWAPIIEQAMAKLPGLQDVTSDQQIASPHLAIDIDRDSASRLGLSLAQIDQTLYDAFGQRQVATIYASSTQYKVVLEVLPSFQADPAALSRIYVTGAERRAGADQHRGEIQQQDRAAHHQPPGPVPGGDHFVQPGARHGARPGGRAHPAGPGRAQDTDHARRLLPGHGPGLPVVSQLHAAPDRGRHPRRLHRAGHALRIVHPSHHDPVGPALGRRRRAPDADALPLRSQRHRPDRHHPADRHRQEERHHDDRLRARGRARAGQEPVAGDPRSLPAALPPDHDDHLRRDRRRPAAWPSARARAPSCAGRSASRSSAA